MEIRGNIIHELAHLLGFYHEHTRIDRDEYIEIIWENIIPNHLNDFEKLNPDVYDSLGVGYDLGSIMHYQLNAFSINDSLPTIRVKEGVNYTGVVGQRNGLSLLDIKQMEYLYQCGAEASTGESVRSHCTRTAEASMEISLAQTLRGPKEKLNLLNMLYRYIIYTSVQGL